MTEWSLRELHNHYLCDGKTGHSYVAFNDMGAAIYAGSFTFYFGDGYFLVSAEGADFEGSCILSINDLSSRRTARGDPAFLLVDTYQDALAYMDRDKAQEAEKEALP